MAKIELHSDFALSGNTLEGFFDAIQSMTDATRVEKVNTEDIQITGIINTENDIRDMEFMVNCGPRHRKHFHEDIRRGKEAYLKQGSTPICRQTGTEPLQFRGIKGGVRNLYREPLAEKLYEELMSRSKMMLKLSPSETKKPALVSPLAFATLNRRLRLDCEAMKKPSVGRFVEYAKSMKFYWPQPIQFIIRQADGVDCIIAAHSPKYAYIKQTILKDMYEEITKEWGRAKCIRWAVNHEYSSCYIGFPDMAEGLAEAYSLPCVCTPGLFIGTSDSGDGSLTIRGVWDIDGKIVGGSTHTRHHRGEIDTNEFVTAASKKIFPEYSVVPARLAELLKMTIRKPANVLRSVAKEIQIGKSSVLGKARSEELLEAMCNEIDPKRRYTAYDLAMSFLSIPGRIEGCHYTLVAVLEECVYKALFADYTEKPEKADPHTPLTLT